MGKNDSDLSANYSNFESSSSRVKQYNPKKTSKFSSIERINKKNNNALNINNIKQNKNKIKNKYDKYDRYNKKTNSNQHESENCISNNEILKNISFGEHKSFENEKNGIIFPNTILDKIKKRTEKYSNELNNGNNTDVSDLNNHKKNVSMIQRIKNMYRSPIPTGTNSNPNSNINTNLTTNRSNRDINNQQNIIYKKQRKIYIRENINLENIDNEIEYEDENENENEEEDKKEPISEEDSSSINNSIYNGIKLQQTKTENLKPIIYTSQSFFIDKKTMNFEPLPNEKLPSISSISYYKNMQNKYPMKMKGDFRKLIEKNPEILNENNPRIQVTNATCEIEQFGDKTHNIINQNMEKNNELIEIVHNCDKDIYESREPYEKQQEKWISMSIPLKNDKAKWVFLNDLKGERHRNNVNKFELIQKYKLQNKNKGNKKIKLNEKKKGISNKSRSLNKILEDSIDDSVQYNLREMNYTQFYRSPMNTSKSENDYFSPPPGKFGRKGDIKRKPKYNTVFNSPNPKSPNYNIEELSGESYE